MDNRTPAATPFDEIVVGAGPVPAPGQGHTPLDHLFAQHAREVAPVFPARPAPVAAPDLTPAGSGELPVPRRAAPVNGTAGDLAAEYAWLREERQRLENYTLNQFALVTRQREELAARRAEVEAAF